MHEHASHYCDFCIGFRPFLLLDCLPDSRKSFDAIARVEAGSIDLMLKPGPAGQPLCVGQTALAFDKDPVYGARPGQRRAAGAAYLCENLFVPIGA